MDIVVVKKEHLMKYGVNCAILLGVFSTLTKDSEGYITASVAELKTFMPFFSDRQIRTATECLEKELALERTMRGQNKMDRTLSYKVLV